jgi:arsenate reductase (glutaredoxin)
MALTVYHYPNCSTCRRALKWLDQMKVAHERVDIVQHPPSRKVLERALVDSGGKLRALFNTSGESYRAGNYKERLATMSEPEALDALAADGKLIKRPLAIADGVALVGFDEAVWQRKLR